jgi:hypothetical protein
MGLSLGNVKTLIHRGKIALAQRMRDRENRAVAKTKSGSGGLHALLLV